MNLSNFKFIEEQYEKYVAGNGVEPSWRYFFEGFEFAKQFAATEGTNRKLEVLHLVQAYRDFGYTIANLNPLEIEKRKSDQLKIENFGLTENDLDQNFETDLFEGPAPLRQIIQHLEKTYCGTCSIQVAESHYQAKKWFTKEMEQTRNQWKPTSEQLLEIQDQLIRTESLEHFVHSRFVGAKRFSIEGADGLIPMLETMVTVASQNQAKEIVLGMAHRGRVNVLANFMGKGLENIFAEFDGHITQEVYDVGGDVKYHLGFSSDRKLPTGPLHLSLAFNPSHLEIVNPVVCGMAKGKQIQSTQDGRKEVIPVLVHGDAAFAGQGVVHETLQLSKIEGYSVGGTIHIIIDNQVGFTADSHETRSTSFATDVSRVILAPVIHVNGDDVEACTWAMNMAVRFRQTFQEDVVINLVCYRRYGHNESDEPTFTQPLMYQKISKHPSLRKIHGKALAEKGILSPEAEEAKFQERIKSLQEILNKARASKPVLKSTSYSGAWKNLRASKPDDFRKSPQTGVDLEVLKTLGQKVTTMPADFSIHPKLSKLFEKRSEMAKGLEGLDWGMGEILAYASLLNEGHSVRLSGQDCHRGTFSHRHCVLRDSKTGKPYSVLTPLFKNKAQLYAYNSPLSELGVLGFEYGHAITLPDTLTIWEAQFGDFVNGAQIVIDQFITAAEVKWYRANGLVLLLPHGYEGQGPEHSSARPERFLQLCAQDNMQVCNLTTPAQIFHALRRQIKREFRKPLVIMTPKSLLRHPDATSPLSDLADSRFQEALDDTTITDKAAVERVILCTGKLYYDLIKARQEKGFKNIAIIRLEQWYPFPDEILGSILVQYTNAKKFVLAQEEPRNMGFMSFVFPRFQNLLMKLPHADRELGLVSRGDRASPATGSHHVHQDQQAKILHESLTS